MPRLHLALRGHYFLDEGDPPRIALPSGAALPTDFPALYRQTLAHWDSPTPALISALATHVSLIGTIYNRDLTLHLTTLPPLLHYFRLADGTVKPLTSDAQILTLSPGDTYLVLIPAPLSDQSIDSPTIARFLHLRDYFNADKLADALLAHLAELDYPPPISLLIVECR